MLVSVVLAMTLAAPVPKVKATPSLDGTWKMAEQDYNGRRAAPANSLTWVVKGEELTIWRGEPSAGGTSGDFGLVVPKGGAANAVDYVVKYEDGKRHVMPGVFEVSGDTLTVCLALEGDRVSEIKSGKGRVVYVLKRVPEVKK